MKCIQFLKCSLDRYVLSAEQCRSSHTACPKQPDRITKCPKAPVAIPPSQVLEEMSFFFCAGALSWFFSAITAT